MNFIQTSKILIRPKTLIASLSPVFISGAYALKNHVFSFPLFLLLGFTALFLQITANIANDYFDGIKGVDHKGRIGPLRMTGSQLGSLNIVKMYLVTSICMTFFLGSLLVFQGGMIIAFVFAISLLVAILYSASSIALSYRGLAEPFAFCFFGPIPVFFGYYIYSHQFSLQAFLLGCLPGFFSLMLITINNLRDLESDMQAKKHTLIVKKGRTFGKRMIYAAVIFQVLVTFIISTQQPVFCLSLIIVPEVLHFLKKIQRANLSQDFFALLVPCSKIYTTSTMLWLSFTMI